MGLSSEMTECIRTGCCPRCSQANITYVGRTAGTSTLTSHAAGLLIHKPKLVSHGFRDSVFDTLNFILYIGELNTRGPTGGWLAQRRPPHFTPDTVKISKDAEHASAAAEQLFLVQVHLDPTAKGPRMRCKMCGQDWLVGEWSEWSEWNPFTLTL